jgi:hypothetical protein
MKTSHLIKLGKLSHHTAWMAVDAMCCTDTFCRTRASGYEEEPDLLKLKDNKGQLIQCFKCGKTSAHGQKIIQCDYCLLNWHLDCLDPPMVHPPPSTNRRTPWKCPNHADHELAINAPETHGRRKNRRPKQPDIVDVYLRRGFRNDGQIEVALDSNDFDDSLYQPNSRVIYRLPESGIKLDFIDKVRRYVNYDYNLVNLLIFWFLIRSTRGHNYSSRRGSQPAHLSSRTATPFVLNDFASRTTADQAAALSLAEFSQTNPDLGLSPASIEALIRTLKV